jgi:predicted dehydrogenase
VRVLVVGFGSMGRRHAANLRSLVPDALIAVWRHRRPSADTDEAIALADAVFYAEEEAVAWRPDAAIVANPAPFHIAAAIPLARQGAHLFIEKPIADRLDGLQVLLELCGKRSLVLMVGYDLRFSQALCLAEQAVASGEIGRPLALRAEVSQFLPDWRPASDYRHGVSARSELGGGVVLELSHELDYATWLLGDVTTVSALTGRVSDLDIDVEDTADILLEFTSGALGNVHLDMVDRASGRCCRVVGTEGTVVWDAKEQRAAIYRSNERAWRELSNGRSADGEQLYIDELSHFLACVGGTASPPVDGNDARRVLELCLAVKESALSGARVKV